MKQKVILAAVCGCLLIGSLYPGLVLEHHVTLVDEAGNETDTEGDLAREIPVKLEWRFLRFLR